MLVEVGRLLHQTIQRRRDRWKLTRLILFQYLYVTNIVSVPVLI